MVKTKAKMQSMTGEGNMKAAGTSGTIAMDMPRSMVHNLGIFSSCLACAAVAELDENSCRLFTDVTGTTDFSRTSPCFLDNAAKHGLLNSSREDGDTKIDSNLNKRNKYSRNVGTYRYIDLRIPGSSRTC